MVSLLVLAPLFARSDGSELFDWLVKIGVFLIFIGIPLIKGIVQARQKATPDGQKGEPGSARQRAAEGRRAFEELMRGGTTIAPPEVPPAVPPVSPPAKTREIETVAPARTAPTRTAQARPLSDLEEIPSRPLTGPEFDAEEGAPEDTIEPRIERREREELQRQREETRRPETIAREEYAASSSVRESVEPVPVEVFGSPATLVADAAGSSEIQRRLFAPRAADDRRAQLRRALVWSEVVGRPVGLRDDADASMPVGLR